MLDSRIKIDEIIKDDDMEEVTAYFIAPKELLSQFISDEIPDNVVHMTISVAFPLNQIEARYAKVEVSPTIDDNGVLEYDNWYEITLPYDEIEELMKIAEL